MYDTVLRDRYLLHLHSVCTDCMYLLLMHVRRSTKKNISCCKYVPTAVSMYLLHLTGTFVYLLMYVRTYCTYRCSYLCAYVPTVRSLLF